MRRPLFPTLAVLLRRDLQEVLGTSCLLLGLLVLVEIALARTPWVRDPEVAPLLSELLAVATVPALVLAVIHRQRGDLHRERLRHLLSLPVTPARVLLSKLLACGLVSGVVLLTANGLWNLYCLPDDPARGVVSVLWTSADMWLVVLLLWAVLTAAAVLGTWLAVLLVWAVLLLARDVPETCHPLTLGIPHEPAGQSLFWARVVAVALILVAFAAAERLLTLRPVE